MLEEWVGMMMVVVVIMVVSMLTGLRFVAIQVVCYCWEPVVGLLKTVGALDHEAPVIGRTVLHNDKSHPLQHAIYIAVVR